MAEAQGRGTHECRWEGVGLAGACVRLTGEILSPGASSV